MIMQQPVFAVAESAAVGGLRRDGAANDAVNPISNGCCSPSVWRPPRWDSVRHNPGMVTRRCLRDTLIARV